NAPPADRRPAMPAAAPPGSRRRWRPPAGAWPGPAGRGLGTAGASPAASPPAPTARCPARRCWPRQRPARRNRWPAPGAAAPPARPRGWPWCRLRARPGRRSGCGPCCRRRGRRWRHRESGIGNRKMRAWSADGRVQEWMVSPMPWPWRCEARPRGGRGTSGAMCWGAAGRTSAWPEAVAPGARGHARASRARPVRGRDWRRRPERYTAAKGLYRTSARTAARPQGERIQMDIAELLAFSVKNKASDLHLSAGLPPMIRVDGDVRRINIPALDHKQVHALVYDIMSDKQRRDYEEFLE